MIRNYFIIAIRQFRKHLLYSGIQVLCLATGLSFCLLIGVYILRQLEVNKQIRNIDRQYLVKSVWKKQNMGIEITTLGPLAKTLREEYPGLVANYYRFDPVEDIVSANGKHFSEDLSIGDTCFISMYGFPLIYGNPEKPFANNQSAVVTEEFAVKYFGRTNVLGERISIQTPADGINHDYFISSVLKKLPVNSISSLEVSKTPCQVFLPIYNNQFFQGGDQGDNWANIFIVNMIELKPGVGPEDLDGPMAGILKKYQPDYVRGNLRIALEPLKNYQLNANNRSVLKLIHSLEWITSFILLLAIINYVNIHIGTSVGRLKEIGLRKVFGGARNQLVLQFLTESLMLTGIALIISLLAYELLRPLFEQILQTGLVSVYHFGSKEILFLVLLTLGLSLTAGIYPAFLLSASPIVESVKGKTYSAPGPVTLRRSLLLVQFSLSILVFICTIIVSRQVNYLFHKDIGYQRDQVMIISSIPGNSDSAGVEQMERFKSEINQVPGVGSVTLSCDIPSGSTGNINVYGVSGQPLSMLLISADQDYARVYNINLKSGLFLSNAGEPAPGNVVLNETAARLLGWKNPVGKTIHLGGADGIPVKIVGLVKDFHFESLRKAINPLVIAGLNESFTRSYRYFSLKLSTNNLPACINSIGKLWSRLFPESGFEYRFMDEEFRKMYKSEEELQAATEVATCLCLLILFMGLFGILAFSLKRRDKEIAVRKVLGASAGNIFLIFIREYGMLFLLSNLIGWPLAFISSQRWLEEFAFRISQGPAPYLMASMILLASTAGIILLQSAKTAFERPVTKLRNE